MYPQIMAEFDDKRTYSNFVAIGERPDFFFSALCKFLKAMKWQQVAILSETDMFSSLVSNYFHEIYNLVTQFPFPDTKRSSDSSFLK